MRNTLFRGILTEKSIYSIILVIQGHLLDGSNIFFCAKFKSDKCRLKKFSTFCKFKVNFKVNLKVNYYFSTNEACGTSV